MMQSFSDSDENEELLLLLLGVCDSNYCFTFYDVVNFSASSKIKFFSACILLFSHVLSQLNDRFIKKDMIFKKHLLILSITVVGALRT